MSRLSLCLIVRDEEERLPACLASVAGVVDEMVVVDTGSTDRSPEIAASYGAQVHHLAWPEDFAAARNHALDLATGDWLLYLDADERLEEGAGPRLRRLLLDPVVEGYFLTIWNHFSDDPRALAPHLSLRLFRRRPAYRFTGRVHETIDPEALRRNLAAFRAAADVRIHHYGYLVDDPRLPAKIARNLALAEREAAEHPDDPLVRFNLGTEYFRLGRDPEALSEYAAARRLIGAKQACFPALLRNGVICRIRLGRLAEAEEEVRRGLMELPDFGELHYLLALIRQMEGDYAGALAALADCLRSGEPPLYYGTLDGTTGYRAHAMAAHCHRMLHEPEKEAGELLLALAAGGPSELRDRLEECLSGLDEEERDRLRGRFAGVLTNPSGGGGPTNS